MRKKELAFTLIINDGWTLVYLIWHICNIADETVAYFFSVLLHLTSCSNYCFASHLSSFFSFSAPRRYLPILRGFPAKYIYDPWNAPEDVQKAAKCIIGVHYPKPMVNHAEASRINIERMKQIYQQLSCYRGLGRDMTQILITSNSTLSCHYFNVFLNIWNATCFYTDKNIFCL